MKKRIRSTDLLTVAATLLTLAAVACVAEANIEVTQSSSTQFTYKVIGIPDFDQERWGLPGAGQSHCVPTSGFDLIAYVGRHGYPGVLGGSRSIWYWQSSLNYDEGTNNVEFVGQIMGTDPDDGTSGQNGLFGMKIFLEPNGLIVGRVGRTSSFTPRYGHMTDAALSGALVMPIVGWYPRLPVTMRSGGHAMAASEFKRSGSSRLVGVRDPATDDDNKGAQGVFKTEKYAVDAREVLLVDLVPRMMDVFAGRGWVNDDGITIDGILDAFYTVAPAHGWTTDNDGLVFVIPVNFPGLSQEVVQHFSLPDNVSIVKIALHPTMIDPYVVTSATDDLPSFIQVFNSRLGTRTTVAELLDARDMVFSRHHLLYAIDEGRELLSFDIDVEPAVEVARRRVDADFVDYDDVNDRVITFDVSSRRIVSTEPDLRSSRGYVLDPDIGLNGIISMCVSPVDGRLWITSTNSPCIYGIELEDDGTTTTESFCNDFNGVRGLQVSDEGHLLFSEDGVLKEYYKLPRGGEWRAYEDSLFAGLPVTGGLSLARSRSNFDESMNDPEWRDVLPESEPAGRPDCRADIDVNGTVDFDDLLLLLAAFGSADIDADVAPPTGDGIIDFDDLLAVLAAWGPCPEE